MSGLALALRGLAARAWLSLALLVVTAFAVGATTAGAIYLRTAGESVLQDTLHTAPPFNAGLAVSQEVRSQREVRRLATAVEAARAAMPALRPPVAGLETRGYPRFDGPTPVSPLPRAPLAGRDGLCQHLVLVSGACPRFRGLDVPAEAAVSTLLAERLRLDLGERFGTTGFTVGGRPRGFVVAGVYRPNPTDPWWFGNHDVFPPRALATEDPAYPAVLVDRRDLAPAIEGGGIPVMASWDLVLDPGRVGLSDASGLALAIGSFRQQFTDAFPEAAVRTGLPALVRQAEHAREALTVPLLLGTAQLVALALLILVVVAAMAAESRAGEVALAKVRGATTGQAFALATAESTLIAVAAVPLGLAAGWAGALAVARAQLVGGVPVVITPLAVASALAAGLVALGAASGAGLDAVHRRVLDQWRQARSPRTGRRGPLVEGILLAVAAASLVNLRTGGARPAGTYDPLAVIAPAVAVLAGALLAGRVLPLVAGAAARATARPGRRSGAGLAAWLGARQVARRSAAALRAVVALAAASGLVAFAVTVHQDLARNRHDRALTETGAASRLRVVFPEPRLGPELVRAADPQGRSAMAAYRWEGNLGASNAPAAVLAVQADRYAEVGFWRGDFASTPLRGLLDPLPVRPRPPLDLGSAEAVEVRLDVLDLRADGPVGLVAELRGSDGRRASLDLGRLERGESGGHLADLDRLGAPGPWQLERLRLDRDEDVAMAATVAFDAVRVRRGGAWAEVEGFTDPGGWRMLDEDERPRDGLRWSAGGGRSISGNQGEAVLQVGVPGGPGLAGLIHASLPEALPAVVTPSLLAAESVKVGQVVRVAAPTSGTVKLQVAGVARVLPGSGFERAAMVDLDQLLAVAAPPADGRLAADQLWLAEGSAAAAAVARLRGEGMDVEARMAAADREAALARQAPSLALPLLVAGAAVAAALAALGLMLHLYLSGRRRSFELAVLHALGGRPRDLWAPLAVEQGALVVYGLMVGAAIGLVAALVALPAIPAFLDRPAVPPPIYTPDWAALGAALGLALVLVCAGLAVTVAGLVRHAQPWLLREEEP